MKLFSLVKVHLRVIFLGMGLAAILFTNNSQAESEQIHSTKDGSCLADFARFAQTQNSELPRVKGADLHADPEYRIGSFPPSPLILPKGVPKLIVLAQDRLRDSSPISLLPTRVNKWMMQLATWGTVLLGSGSIEYKPGTQNQDHPANARPDFWNPWAIDLVAKSFIQEDLVGQKSLSSFGGFILQMEHSFDKTTGNELLGRDMQAYNELLQTTRKIFSDNAEFMDQVDKFREYLFSEYLQDYCRENAQIRDYFEQYCGSCVAQTYLILSLLRDAHVEIPREYILGVQAFKDHLRPVLYNPAQESTLDLVYGTPEESIRGPVFRPGIIPFAYLKKRHSNDIGISEKDFLIAQPLARGKNGGAQAPKAPLTQRSDEGWETFSTNELLYFGGGADSFFGDGKAPPISATIEFQKMGTPGNPLQDAAISQGATGDFIKRLEEGAGGAAQTAGAGMARESNVSNLADRLRGKFQIVAANLASKPNNPQGIARVGTSTSDSFSLEFFDLVAMLNKGKIEKSIIPQIQTEIAPLLADPEVKRFSRMLDTLKKYDLIAAESGTKTMPSRMIMLRPQLIPSIGSNSDNKPPVEIVPIGRYGQSCHFLPDLDALSLAECHLIIRDARLLARLRRAGGEGDKLIFAASREYYSKRLQSPEFEILKRVTGHPLEMAKIPAQDFARFRLWVKNWQIVRTVLTKRNAGIYSGSPDNPEIDDSDIEKMYLTQLEAFKRISQDPGTFLAKVDALPYMEKAQVFEGLNLLYLGAFAPLKDSLAITNALKNLTESTFYMKDRPMSFLFRELLDKSRYRFHSPALRPGEILLQISLNGGAVQKIPKKPGSSLSSDVLDSNKVMSSTSIIPEKVNQPGLIANAQAILIYPETYVLAGVIAAEKENKEYNNLYSSFLERWEPKMGVSFLQRDASHPNFTAHKTILARLLNPIYLAQVAATAAKGGGAEESYSLIHYNGSAVKNPMNQIDLDKPLDGTSSSAREFIVPTESLRFYQKELGQAGDATILATFPKSVLFQTARGTSQDFLLYAPVRLPSGQVRSAVLDKHQYLRMLEPSLAAVVQEEAVYEEIKSIINYKVRNLISPISNLLLNEYSQSGELREAVLSDCPNCLAQLLQSRVSAEAEEKHITLVPKDKEVLSQLAQVAYKYLKEGSVGPQLSYGGHFDEMSEEIKKSFGALLQARQAQADDFWQSQKARLKGLSRVELENSMHEIGF